MHVIGLVLFAMALGLGALFLLAKAQKENLGKLYSVSAYIVLTVAVLTILFSITAGIMHCCHKNKCGGGGCGKNKMEQGCSKGDAGCKMKKGGCKSDGHCGATMSSCSMSEAHCEMMGGGSCSKGGMKCGKGGDCMMMNHHGGKMFEKRVIKTMDGDSAKVEVKINH